MMLDLASRLIALGFKPHLPDASGDFDCVMLDEEEGPFIAEWLSPLPQPSVEELEAATPRRTDVPETISDRQFFQQLAVAGLITEDEAIDAVATGAVPVAMQAVIDSLPADQKFAALMLLRGAISFERHHPLVAVFASAMGMTDAETDDLWVAASAL